MQRNTARIPPGGQARGTERGATPDTHEGHEGGERCLHPCQRTDRQEGLGCLCRGLQTRRMDSLLGAEPRDTWVQRFHRFVAFRPHRVFLALRGLPLAAASGAFLSGALAALPAELPAARGIFTDQRRALCPLRWQVDSQPLDDQGSPLGGAFNLTQSKAGAP